MKALMAEGMQLEAYGGDIPSVEVSGLTGQGLPDLVETLSAMAEVQDLRAEQDGPVHGHVLESKIQKGFGYVPSCFNYVTVMSIITISSGQSQVYLCFADAFSAVHIS